MPIYVLVRGPFARFQVLAAGRVPADGPIPPPQHRLRAGAQPGGDRLAARRPELPRDPGPRRPPPGPDRRGGGRGPPARPGRRPAPARLPRGAGGQGPRPRLLRGQVRHHPRQAGVPVEPPRRDRGRRPRRPARPGPGRRSGGAGATGVRPGAGLPGRPRLRRSHVGLVDDPPEAFWYRPVGRDERIGDLAGATTLSVRIDRSDSSRTVSRLFVPLPEPTARVPESAWQECGP